MMSLMTKTYSSSYKVLSFEQFQKLDQLMNKNIEIHGQGTFPSIKVTLKEFVVCLKSELRKENPVSVPVGSIRLNGGAASHVVGARQMMDDIGYNDLDLIFFLALPDQEDMQQMFETVRQRLYDTLRNLPTHDNHEGGYSPRIDQLSDPSINEGYVEKLVKVVNPNDCWSLISLYNNDGENVEVKFVHRMKRQYEFSVDSFQIELDSLLSYYESNNDSESKSSVTFTDNFFLTVMAESKYGKFDEALFHLNNKLVATLRPEEIRGGGLLKYCNLLLNGYQIADSDIKNMQKYMCSRFFIDFADAEKQQKQLNQYIKTHLRRAPKSLRGYIRGHQNAAAQMAGAGSNGAATVVSQPGCGSTSEKTTISPGASSEDKENVNESCNNAAHHQQVLKEKEKFGDGTLECYRINFLRIVRDVIDHSTVCLMNIERACTLNLLDSMIYDLCRSFYSKREGGKYHSALNFEGGTESGYFGSENSSSISGPSLPSPSHFSRSSSPSNFSINGATTSSASRSSSPASAAFTVSAASRLQTPVEHLAALTSTGGFLHPNGHPMGINFTPTPPVYLPFAPLHNVSMMQNSGNFNSSRNGNGGVGQHHHHASYAGAALSNGQHHNHSQLHNHCQQINNPVGVGGGSGGQYQHTNSGAPSSSTGHQNQHQSMSSSSHYPTHQHNHHSSHHGHHGGNHSSHRRNRGGGMHNRNAWNNSGSNNNSSNAGSNNMHHNYHHGNGGGNNHQYHNYHINSNHAGSSYYYGGGNAGGRSNNNCSSYYQNQYNPYYPVLGYHNQQYQQQHHQTQNHLLGHFQNEEEDPNVATINTSSSTVSASTYGWGIPAIEEPPETSLEESCDNSEEQLAGDSNDADSLYQLTDQSNAASLEETSPDDEFGATVSQSRSAETPPDFCQKGGSNYGPSESTTPLALAAF